LNDNNYILVLHIVLCTFIILFTKKVLKVNKYKLLVSIVFKLYKCQLYLDLIFVIKCTFGKIRIKYEY